MPIESRDREDFEYLFGIAEAGRRRGLANFLHLDQPIGIWNYIRIANEIAARIPSGRLLDWGCGFGQMTYLLRRRGFQVVPFDIAQTVDTLPELPLTRQLGVVRAEDATHLPFPDESFDAVLSCGVLEHVDEYSEPGNEVLSLQEIRRVLRPNGYFPIYQLPQKYTWQEAVTRLMRVGYSHPRRFSEAEIRQLLARTNFRVERVRRRNMLPKNLTGVPTVLRNFYSRFSDSVNRLDAALSSIPIVNRIAGVLEIMARRSA